MKVVQDGPSWVLRSVVSVRRWTLGKFLETLFRGVSDHHDGRAGRTVVGQRSVTGVDWEGARAYATDPTTVHREYDGPYDGPS